MSERNTSSSEGSTRKQMQKIKKPTFAEDLRLNVESKSQSFNDSSEKIKRTQPVPGYAEYTRSKLLMCYPLNVKFKKIQIKTAYKLFGKKIPNFLIKPLLLVKANLKPILSLAFFFLFLCYFIAVHVIDAKRAVDFSVVGGMYFCYIGLKLWWACVRYFYKYNIKPKISQVYRKKPLAVKITLYVLALVLFALIVAFIVPRQIENYVPLFGVIFILLITFITSVHPTKVNIRTLVTSLYIQFLIAVFALKTQFAIDAIEWISNLFVTIVSFGEEGRDFVFKGVEDVFAFKTMPLIVFISALIYLSIYYGVITFFIKTIGAIIIFVTDVTMVEALNSVANIIFGMSEAPLVLRPFLSNCTTTEIYIIVVGGLATLSVKSIAIYVDMGVNPAYLFTCLFMSAPGALALGKLNFPEVEKPEEFNVNKVVFPKPEEKNAVEALGKGAMISIPIISAILANQMVYVSLLEMVNSLLRYLGDLVDVPNFTFELIFSYIFYPFSFFMGIPHKDRLVASELLAIKLFLNEFVAFRRMSYMLPISPNATNFDPQQFYIEPKTATILTFAISSFANFGSLGIMYGALVSMAPSKSGVAAEIMIRGLFFGFFVTILNGCWAGMILEN